MTETIRKLLSLLTPGERRRLLVLMASTLLVALLQVAGIASIMPFLALVSNPDVVHENEKMYWVYTTLGFDTTNHFLIFAGFAVVALLTLGNAFSALMNWLELKFVWSTNHRISRDLLLGYLHEPYLRHLDRNASELSATILSEVQSVVGGLLKPSLYVITRSLVAVTIIALLIWVDVILALTIALILGGAYAAIYLWATERLDLMGRERLYANAQRFKVAGEALGGFKETKILGRELEFIRRYAEVSEVYAQRQTRVGVFKEIPRYAMESVAFGGIVVIILYLLASHEDLRQVLPILSLYAVAGYKLLPTLQAVFSNLTLARYHLPALEGLYGDILEHYPVEITPSEGGDGVRRLDLEREITLDQVTFRYPGSHRHAVADVSLRIPKYSSVGFVGATGSGKTTTVDIIAGLLTPEEGALRIDGLAIDDETLKRAWRMNLGYIPQQIFLCDGTIRHNIAFGLPDSQIDEAAVRRAAKLANLHDFISTLPRGYDTVVGDQGVRLSGGQRQRIGIARALYHDPHVLIMDEATSSLDGITEQVVMSALRTLAHQKTVIVIAHRLSTVMECDRIFLMEEGRIIASGSYTELMDQNDLFREMAAVGALDAEEGKVV